MPRMALPIEEKQRRIKLRRKIYWVKHHKENYDEILDKRRARKGIKPVIEDLLGELWRPITDYENWYEISNFGRVKRIKCAPGTYAGRLNKTSISKGYKQTALSKNGMVKHHLQVHVLVAKAFIPNPENKPEVNHIDGIKLNNWAENLEWMTRKENAEHASENNLLTHGENHHMTKLTEDQVIDIHDMGILHKKEIYGNIAPKYDVSPSTIWAIQHEKTWKYLWKEGVIR